MCNSYAEGTSDLASKCAEIAGSVDLRAIGKHCTKNRINRLNFLILVLQFIRDSARFEQNGQIDGVGGIAQKWSHAEDFLHGRKSEEWV